jgi:hypothetical protein
MGETYLVAVLRFALRRSLVLTDRLSIIAAVLVPAIWQTAGKPMPEWVAGYVAWLVIIAVGGGAGLRFVTAPYFIWREQNKTISELRTELAKPEQSIKARMHDDIATARVGLLDQLMRIHERFGVRAYNPAEYSKSLRHEGASIPAAKLIHDEGFARLWNTHVALLTDAERYANSTIYMLRVGFDRVDNSHQALVRFLQFKA